MSLAGKRILVTGGTGAFGKAFVRHVLDKESPHSVRVFSRDEAKHAPLKASLKDDRLRFLLGDVRDRERLTLALRDVDVVIHAAAMKRVEECEDDPEEAVHTNVWGTWNVARACIDCGVERAVFLSTDKAAAPNTLYGATKLVAERLWIRSNVYGAGTDTRFSATRYGNVLGSTGSVVPIWKQQALTGNITVTDSSMTRFWMHMDQAVGLVLYALKTMNGGEVFIPKIGAAPIMDLASAVAPGSAVTFSGLRPGEKIHETLVTQDEARQTYDCGSCYVILPANVSWRSNTAPENGVPVSPAFTYTSDTAKRLSVEKLRELIQ